MLFLELSGGHDRAVCFIIHLRVCLQSRQRRDQTSSNSSVPLVVPLISTSFLALPPSLSLYTSCDLKSKIPASLALSCRGAHFPSQRMHSMGVCFANLFLLNGFWKLIMWLEQIFAIGPFRVCCLVSFVFGWFENKYLEPGGLLQKKCWYKGGKRAIILKFAFSPVANSPNYKLMTVCLVQEMGQWKVSYRHKEKLALTLDKEKQAQKKSSYRLFRQQSLNRDKSRKMSIAVLQRSHL